MFGEINPSLYIFTGNQVSVLISIPSPTLVTLPVSRRFTGLLFYALEERGCADRTLDYGFGFCGQFRGCCSGDGRGITADKTKFYHVASALAGSTAARAMYILEDPPALWKVCVAKGVPVGDFLFVGD